MLAEQVDNAQRIIAKIIEFLVAYAFEAAGAILILAAGWVVARLVAEFIKRWLERYAIDVTVTKFLIQLVKWIIYALAAVMALAKFGFNIAPIVAGLSVVGFGTSFALQGPLSNYAAGATLIFTKPFKVGDIIEVVNVAGEVEDMALARTMVRTVDGTVIVIPNKHIIGEVIHNYSRWKRLEIAVGIGYDVDATRAIGVVRDVLHAEPRITRNPASRVGIKAFGDSSINLEARAWCKQADYWDTLYTINQRIFDRFKAEGITIPYPQREVRLKTGA